MPPSLTFLSLVCIAFPTGTAEIKCNGYLSFHVTAISSPFFLNRESPLGKFLTRGSLWSMISFGRSFWFGWTAPRSWIPTSLKVKKKDQGLCKNCQWTASSLYLKEGLWGKQQHSLFDSALPPLCGQCKLQNFLPLNLTIVISNWNLSGQDIILLKLASKFVDNRPYLE